MGKELSHEQSTYTTEFLLCDQFWEFHPDLFEDLSKDEREDLLRYYSQNLTAASDVFAYRREVLSTDPDLEARARASLAKGLSPAGVSMPDTTPPRSLR